MIKIDKEFKELIPPLSQEEYTQLEKNILKDGIREPLVVWKLPNGEQILIDGHNRLKIAEAHPGIKYEVREMTFDLREDVKKWIIMNQFGRRNLSAYDRSLLALKLKPVMAEMAKESQGERTDISQKSVKSHDTQKELAKIANVSHDTIHKVEFIEENATDKTKQMVRDGKMSINQAYRAVKPTHPTPLKAAAAAAKQEHAQFEEKKKAGVVSIDDAKIDKINLDIMDSTLMTDLLKMLNSIDKFRMSYSTGDFARLRKRVDKEERSYLSGQCRGCQATLQSVIDEIGG